MMRWLVLVLVVAACGDAHLGARHGKRTRAALERQTERRAGDQAPGIQADAKDARRILARHRGQETKSAEAPAVTAPVIIPGAPVTGGGGGGTVQSNGPIRLEAK